MSKEHLAEARAGLARFDAYIAEARDKHSPLHPYLAHYEARRLDWAFVVKHFTKRGKP